MAKTTVEKVRLLASETSSMSREAMEIHVEDAYLSVSEDGFPEKFEEVANRYLAAHLATANKKYVIAEAVGTLKREYAEKDTATTDLNTTTYGQEYLRLKEKYIRKRGGGLSMVVI